MLNLVAGEGIEPSQALLSLGYEPSVLPLHYPTILGGGEGFEPP